MSTIIHKSGNKIAIFSLMLLLVSGLGLAQELTIEAYQHSGDEVVMAGASMLVEAASHADVVAKAAQVNFEIESFEHGDEVVAAPLMLIEKIENGVASVVWESIPGKSYRLCECQDLASGRFTDVSGRFVATSDITRLLVPVGRGCAFRVDLLD